MSQKQNYKLKHVINVDKKKCRLRNTITVRPKHMQRTRDPDPEKHLGSVKQAIIHVKSSSQHYFVTHRQISPLNNHPRPGVVSGSGSDYDDGDGGGDGHDDHAHFHDGHAHFHADYQKNSHGDLSPYSR